MYDMQCCSSNTAPVILFLWSGASARGNINKACVNYLKKPQYWPQHSVIVHSDEYLAQFLSEGLPHTPVRCCPKQCSLPAMQQPRHQQQQGVVRSLAQQHTRLLCETDDTKGVCVRGGGGGGGV